MQFEGVLKLNNGRAELVHDGEVFSFPGRLARERVIVTIPDVQQTRSSDPAAAAGASPQAVRGIFRLQNGRAELTLATNEVVSFPARYAGRVIGIEVVNLAAAAAQHITPPAGTAAALAGSNFDRREQGDRALLAVRFNDEDLDVLG